MRVTRVGLRSFRTFARADVALGAGLTVVHGRNGAGKTNLLEGLYFACTGRSCRTANEREVVAFGAELTRLELEAADDEGLHTLSVGFAPGEQKRVQVDGATVERLLDVERRPLVSVFLPDRLELVKGAPAGRRAHLDQVVAALWPSRRETRSAYGRALAQRNALLVRLRGTGLAASAARLRPWDAQLAEHGMALMADRAGAVARLRDRFPARAADLGLDGEPHIAYRPRSHARDAAGLAEELAERVPSDLERGFTAHGPHRDDLAFVRSGRELRSYGSQGQQRLALLALLLAEREALAETRAGPPLLLLDDVMSELDAGRRERLVSVLRTGGQSLITTTDLAHVPGADAPEVVRLAVADGAVLTEAAAA
jgi:DNA replication and repair protein RecF